MARMKRQSNYLHRQDDWKKLYESGMSFTEIGNQEVPSVHYTTVQGVLRGVVERRPKQTFVHLAKEWVTLYAEQELSINTIAKQYKTDPTTVSKYLKLEGIELRRKSGRTPKLNVFISEWVQKYELGLSLKNIADEYGTFPQTVHKYIKDKVEMREYTETSMIYHIERPDYLSEINTHQKAYWLGIWYGTGFVSKSVGGYESSLVVSSIDKDTLCRFNRTIGNEKPLEEFQEGNAHVVKVRIFNKIFYDIIESHGLSTDKLQRMTIPSSLPSEFYNSYILGYYEGKGSCLNGTYQAKEVTYSKISFSLFGNEDFLQSLKKIIQRETGISLHSGLKKNINVFYLRTGVRDHIRVLSQWLYRDIESFAEHRDIRKIL